MLTTPRLLLRALTAADLDDLRALDADPAVMRYLSDSPSTVREGRWAAVERESGAFLGWFALDPISDGVVELGYRLRVAAWGRGFATEGARALVDHAFRQLEVARVVATTMAVNAGSRRVLEKCGLRHVRTWYWDGPDPLPGAEYGDVDYALDQADWAVTRNC